MIDRGVVRFLGLLFSPLFVGFIYVALIGSCTDTPECGSGWTLLGIGGGVLLLAWLVLVVLTLVQGVRALARRRGQ